MEKEMFKMDLVEYIDHQRQCRKEARQLERDRMLAKMIVMAFLAFSCIVWGLVAW